MITASATAMEETHRTKGLVRLTMACNERCLFCNVPVEDYPRPTPPVGELEAEIDAFAASGERTLTISGGEPTLYRERLLALVRRARERGVPFVELQTNAILIDEAYAGALAAAGVTSAFVSLLSDDAELHDALTAVPGSWQRCLRGIDAMHAAGLRITLNPVIARTTQERLADFVGFVAARLPFVRSISVSAVQPHGRAHGDPELLPDYARLREIVPRARARAAEHGIEFLNPYCGLPLCIGWSDDLEHCVEAAEARAGEVAGRGLENRGDKSHGAPCIRCALRPWCAGAWHAYWTVRGGSGIAAPDPVVEPWAAAADAAPGQQIVRAPGGATAATWSALAATTEPTVWLWTDALQTADVAPLRASRCSELAVVVDPASFARGDARARDLVAALTAVRDAVRIWLAMPRDPSARAHVPAVVALAERLGCEPPVWVPRDRLTALPR